MVKSRKAQKYQQYKIEKASLEFNIKTFQSQRQSIFLQKDSALLQVANLSTQLSNLQLIISSLQETINGNRIAMNYDSVGRLINVKYESGIRFYLDTRHLAD